MYVYIWSLSKWHRDDRFSPFNWPLGCLVVVLVLAGEHVDEGLDVDKTLVVDVHVVERFAGLLRGEPLAPGDQRVS